MFKQVVSFLRMARPDQLVAVWIVSTTGGFIGAATWDSFQIPNWIWGQICLLCCATSIHYANEYADVETDALTQRTAFSGGSGASQFVQRHNILHAAWFALLLGFVLAMIGISLSLLPSVAILVLVIGTIFGWMYSLHPMRLAWHGWGELDNALLGGLLLPIYGYVIQSTTIDWHIFSVSLPFTTLVFNNLLATTWADRKADAAVGKYTLATLWTRQQLRLLYAVVAIIGLALAFIYLPPLIQYGFVMAFPFLGWGWWTYTHWHKPHPSVFAMITIMIIQFLGWGFLTFHPTYP